jgi:hypothetical protein
MGMMRRVRRLATPWALVLLCTVLCWMAASCRETPTAVHPVVALHAPHEGRAAIGILAPDTQQVDPLIHTLRSELSPDFDVQVFWVHRGTTPDELRQAIETIEPNALVLVDNSVAQLYAPLAAALPAPPASIIVMASFVEHVQPTVKNSMAIAFETPAVTTLSQVRALLERPLRRAGVVYRAGFEQFVEQERVRALQEEIELVPVRVPSSPNVASLSRALRRLERSNLDAVWISNDNVLLTQRLLARAWLPFARKVSLPIVVGVPGLVKSSVPFATYAAVPDPVGLGVQTADLVFALQSAGWKPQVPRVHPPVAVKTYLNVDHAQALGITADNQARVDVLLSPGEP